MAEECIGDVFFYLLDGEANTAKCDVSFAFGGDGKCFNPQTYSRYDDKNTQFMKDGSSRTSER